MVKFSSAFTLKIAIACLLTLGRVAPLTAQARSVLKYFEVISGDSVKLYFSELYTFTSKQCADVIRYSRMSERGTFTGTFVDITKDSVRLETGRYDEGVKDGYFEEFYPSGVLKSKGTYKEDMPSGDWYFYHENGVPERQIKFTGADTLLVMQTSAKGDILVSQGEGTFNGEVEGIPGVRNLTAKGKIEGGKRTGKWKSYFAGSNPLREYVREDFDHGKLTGGIHSGASNGVKKDFCCCPAISLFLTPSFVVLEKFPFASCDLLANTFTKEAQLKSKGVFDKVVLSALYEKNYFKYGSGNEKLKLGFTVNDEGIPKNFKVYSSPNEVLTNRLVYLLSQRVRWSPAIKNKKPHAQDQYLNVVYVDTGTGFRYEYWLSLY